VDEEPQERVYWLTRTLPKTLDQSGAGRLTRSFIARYGKSDSVRENLYRHFFAQSWCGKESDYFRKLREQTRTWAIDERNKLVKQWITDYAEMLDDAIKHAEIQEERGR
jgi:DNA-binding transcriptional regulator PaaX